MGACDSLIKKDIAANCGSVFTKGLEANGVIVNRQDIDFGSTVFDTTRKNIINALLTTPGSKAYEVCGRVSTPFTAVNTSHSTHR